MSIEADKFLKAVDAFRKLKKDMPSQTISIFLYIAIHSEKNAIPFIEIQKKLNMAQSSVSRNINFLSKYSYRNKIEKNKRVEGLIRIQGLDLVNTFEDPMERRRKLVELNKKGKDFYNSILKIIL